MIVDALSGVQRCKMRTAHAKGHARMSGDMCTSLGNGFTNLMLALFAAQEYGWASEVAGVVEGDDGLFRADGPVPPESFYARLGFIIKLEQSEDLGKAGFCQTYFDSNDEFPQNVVNPLKFLGKAGWTTSSAKHGGKGVLRQLAVAKAFSLLFMAPNGPVISSLARWVLRCNPGVPVRESEDWWEREMFRSSSVQTCLAISKIPPTDGQRRLVEDLWGLSIADQIEIENYFDSRTTMGPIDHPTVYECCQKANPAWSQNWDTHVVHVPAGYRW
jgi:hypothetical protein